jgi:hypothetical protein
MAEMDIGFGPGKFSPDLNTQMGGIDPFLEKAKNIKTPEEGINVAVDLAGEERRLQERETAAKIKKEKALPEIEAAFKAEEGRLVKEARTREQDVMAEAEQAMSQFTVSKETLGGMATLASVIGVLGSLAGNTGGRQAGFGAIKSMTGMMAGPDGTATPIDPMMMGGGDVLGDGQAGPVDPATGADPQTQMENLAAEVEIRQGLLNDAYNTELPVRSTIDKD